MRNYFLLIIFFFISTVFSKDLMLAKKYENQAVKGWLMSEKYDGVRAFWDGKNLISRQGYKFSAPQEFIKDFPPFVLDGELFYKRGEFEATVSKIRSDSYQDWQELHYLIFDVPKAEGGLLERLKILENYLKNQQVKHLKIIEQRQIQDFAEAEKFLAEVIDNGGEGVILLEPTMAYVAGRSEGFLKLKPYEDAECKVLEHLEGKGKYKGKLGSIVCKMDNGKNIKIGSGFKDKDRENPPKIGSIISFKFNGYTKNGLPRFPRFLRIRNE